MYNTTYLSLSVVLLLFKISENIAKWEDMSLINGNLSKHDVEDRGKSYVSKK